MLKKLNCKQPQASEIGRHNSCTPCHRLSDGSSCSIAMSRSNQLSHGIVPEHRCTNDTMRCGTHMQTLDYVAAMFNASISGELGPA